MEDERDSDEMEIEENLLEKFSAGSFIDIIQNIITSSEDDEEESEDTPRFSTELQN